MELGCAHPGSLPACSIPVDPDAQAASPAMRAQKPRLTCPNDNGSVHFNA